MLRWKLAKARSNGVMALTVSARALAVGLVSRGTSAEAGTDGPAAYYVQNGRTEAIHVAHTLVPRPQDTIIVNITNNRRIVTGRASARMTRTVRFIG
jgi:hypothetical protein